MGKIVNCKNISTLTLAFFLIVIVFAVIFYKQWLLTQHQKESDNTVADPMSFMDSMDFKFMNFTQKNQIIQSFMLKAIASKLRKAAIHAKSMRALRLIRTVIDDMDDVFSKLGMDYNKVHARYLKPEPKSVCPEKHEGNQFGVYDKKLTLNQCSHGKPISALVTIVTISFDKSRDFRQLLEKCSIYFPNVSVIIGSNYSLNKLPSSVIVQDNMKGTPGKMWNSLITRVSTPYTLIARDVIDIDKQVDLQRLIKEKELFNVAAVGGSLNDRKTFHQKIGCYQRSFRNYTLVYEEGYDEAQHGCLVCDHIDGPFLIETKKLNNIKFDFNLNVGIFEDFFLRLGLEQAIVCPDIMFHASIFARPEEELHWEKMASKHEIYKLKFIPGFEIIFPCKRPYACHQNERNIISPCCMKELNNMILQVVHFCEKNGIICELLGGTGLAAIKMNMAFPWDIDADIVFLLSNFSVVSSKFNELDQRPQFWTELATKPMYENKTLVLGSYNLYSINWFVEFWGTNYMSTTNYIIQGKNQTKALLYGTWVGMPTNPCAWARNRYSNDFFFHVEHWRELGRQNGYLHIPSDSSGRFRSCKTPGDHKCLDNFNAIGNLQFNDPFF